MSHRLVWMLAVRSTGDFGRDVIDVVRRPLPIDVAERVGLRVSLDRLGDGRAEHEGVVDVLIGPAQALLPVRRGLETPDGFVRILEVEGILPAAMGEAVDLQELVGKDVIEHHVAQATAAQAHRLGLGQRREPKRHQKLQGRDLGLVAFSAASNPLTLSLMRASANLSQTLALTTAQNSGSRSKTGVGP